jgi:hypothetical protein
MKDPRALIGNAYARVDRGDWSRWIPHPADPVLMFPMAPLIPPLTQGMVMAFVNFQAWLLGQPPNLYQYQAWDQRFRTAWQMSDRLAIRDFLATLLLSGDLLQQSPRKRESMRAPLGQLLWDATARPEPLPSWRLPEAAPSPTVRWGTALAEPRSAPASTAAREQPSEPQRPAPASVAEIKHEGDLALWTSQQLHHTFMTSLEALRH